MSTCTVASTVTPYYGSRVPKPSADETDRVIFQMMDDLKTVKEESTETDTLQTDKTTRDWVWNLRMVLLSVMMILFVIGKKTMFKEGVKY
ncbi:hypothetical protein BY458DRAFT_560503 [Sporodiniella umbellata]|nr:hypothetical protein BY458DRAFT_560503 [Sporodiniella umbellata]